MQQAEAGGGLSVSLQENRLQLACASSPNEPPVGLETELLDKARQARAAAESSDHSGELMDDGDLDSETAILDDLVSKGSHSRTRAASESAGDATPGEESDAEVDSTSGSTVLASSFSRRPSTATIACWS